MSSQPERAVLAAYAAALAAAVADELDDFVSIVWKGSTFKEWKGRYDFLPGLSDLDIHVYRHGPLADPWQVRERVHAATGPVPYNTPLQLLVLDLGSLPDWWTLLPGTYGVLAGDPPPVAVPAHDVLIGRDRFGLARATAEAGRVLAEVLGLADGELWAYLRSVRHVFPSALGRVVSVGTNDPAATWRMTRTEQLAALRELESTGGVESASVGYLEAALAAGEAPGEPGAAERALRSGYELLQTAAKWFVSRPDAVVDRRRRPHSPQA